MSYHTNNRSQPRYQPPAQQPPAQRSAPAPSPHEVQPSPHEVQPSPHEVQPSPHRQVVDEPELTPSPLVSAPPQDAELIETGPFSFRRYYPLFNTIQGAVDASPKPSHVRPGENTVGYHVHTFDNGRIIYYMPNGLEMGVTQFHGDFSVEKMLLSRVTTRETTEEVYRGEWKKLKLGTTTFERYHAGDIVTKNGVAYIANKDVDGQIDPEENSYVSYEPLRVWDVYAGRPTKIDGGFF